MSSGSAEDRAFKPRRLGFQPIDYIVGAYFVFTGILLVIFGVFGDRVDWRVPLAVRLVFFGIMLFLRRSPVPRNRWWWLLRLSYPIFFYPYFYGEIQVLNQLITRARFDEIVIAWEQAIFRCMPSVDLRRWLNWKPLSEYLHLAYISYLLLAPFTIFTLFLKRKMDAVTETVTTVTLTFISCYLFFIFFPVLGPFQYLTPKDPANWGWFFPQFTHFVLLGGSSVGSAFPSSHVAVAVSLLIQAGRHDRLAFWVLLALVPGLAFGAVYGGFHYATDAVAGLLLALITTRVGPHMWRLMEAAQDELSDRRRLRRAGQ